MALERAHQGASNAMAFRLLNSGLSIPELRAASPLEDNAQRIVDKSVTDVGLERLVFAGDIISAGLTYPLNDPLSVMEVAWESISKTGGAQRTMNPSARGENQLPDRKMKAIPVYLTTDDFSMGIRTLKMSERVGQPLDTTLVQQATRRVNEAIEDAAINGAGVTIGSGTTPGVLNAPNANQYTLTVDWTAPNVIGTTGPKMVDDVLAMVGIAQADKHYGPFTLYVGTKAGLGLAGDYKTNTTDTINQRLLQIPGLTAIKVADQMPGGPTGPQAFLIQMTSDVVDMITGQSPTVIPWTSNDGFTLFWLVMAIMIPRFRTDYDGNSGIVIGSK
jgi:Family of unknown function (DUF6260)